MAFRLRRCGSFVCLLPSLILFYPLLLLAQQPTRRRTQSLSASSGLS